MSLTHPTVFRSADFSADQTSYNNYDWTVESDVAPRKLGWCFLFFAIFLKDKPPKSKIYVVMFTKNDASGLGLSFEGIMAAVSIILAGKFSKIRQPWAWLRAGTPASWLKWLNAKRIRLSSGFKPMREPWLHPTNDQDILFEKAQRSGTDWIALSNLPESLRVSWENCLTNQTACRSPRFLHVALKALTKTNSPMCLLKYRARITKYTWRWNLRPSITWFGLTN